MHLGQVEPASAPKIEVISSRRDQRRQQMPPPPPMPPQSQRMPDRAPGQFRPPDWAGVPPHAAFLDVIKAGQVIDRLTLRGAATVFGRYGQAQHQASTLLAACWLFHPVSSESVQNVRYLSTENSINIIQTMDVLEGVQQRTLFWITLHCPVSMQHCATRELRDSGFLLT